MPGVRPPTRPGYARRMDGATLPPDLETFGRRIAPAVTVEAPDPFEHHLRWSVRDREGSTRVTRLHCGIVLTTTRLRWEQPWGIAVDLAPTPRMKFVLTRGPALRIHAADGSARSVASGRVHVRGEAPPGRLGFAFGTATRSDPHEQLALELERPRLLALFGVATLPAALEQLPGSFATTPAVLRTFDELLGDETTSRARRIHREAKGLELLAHLFDAAQELECAARPLGPADVDRLERARRILVARMAEPPSLAALAREVGVNETKLKAGFRRLFGDTVFGVLRRERMEEAHRLLRTRRYGVSEVALRVGYANPSKFAAAFRARFGLRPSDVA